MKPILLTPGPTMVPNFVWKAMEENQGIAHHRHPDYLNIVRETRNGLRRLFDASDGVVMLFRGGGRTMMEAVITNFCSRTSRVSIINTGKFADEWRNIATTHGVPVREIKSEWGYTFKENDLATHLLPSVYHPDLLLMQAADTSTGVLNDWKTVCAYRSHFSNYGLSNTLIAIDAVLEGGVSKIRMKKDNIDILVGASQKAFMLPPGLSFIILRPNAVKRLASRNIGIPTAEFNMREEIDAIEHKQTRFTPPTHIIIGLHTVLNNIFKFGEDNWYEGHQLRAIFVREYFQKFGLGLFTKDAPTDAVSLFSLPPEISAVAIQQALRESGYIVETGQDSLKDSVIRVAHFAGVELSTLVSFCETFKELFLKKYNT